MDLIRVNDIANGRWTYITRLLNRTFDSYSNHITKSAKVFQADLKKAATTNEKFLLSEKIRFCETWVEYMGLCSHEAELMNLIAKYAMIINFERTKMKLHIKYIFKENTWLKDEMYDLHKLLIKLENYYLIAEAEKRHFQYYYNMRNYTKLKKSVSVSSGYQFQEEEEDSDPDEVVPATLTAIYNLVIQFMSESRHTVAMSWCEKNLVDYQKKYGEVSGEVGALYALLGRIYKDYGLYVTAQEYFESAISIREKVHGKTSDPVGISLSLLGSTLGKKGNNKEALDKCKKALEIREKIHGRYHPEVAHLYAKIGSFHYKMKHYNDVITYYKICLVTYENLYDPTELSVINAYIHLSSGYIYTDNLDKAKECLDKVNIAYYRKNNPGSSRTVTPFSFILDMIKKKAEDWQGETLLNKFGPVSEVSDEKLVEIMIQYFNKINETKTSEILKAWMELSNLTMNHSEVGMLNETKAKTKSKPNRSDSTSSVKSNKVKSGITNMFKKSKN